MAWGRLALIQAAGQGDAELDNTAQLFGYQFTAPAPIAERQFRDTEDTQHDSADSLVKTTLPVSSKRPPERFLRVIRRVRLANNQTEKPFFLDAAVRELPPAKADESYRFPPPRPLLAMSRLLPFLQIGLGQLRSAGKLDYARLSKQLASGKALLRLPFLPRQRWPQRLLIIVDVGSHLEPFWADFALIILELQKCLGQEAVTAICLDADSLETKQPLVLSWPTKPSDTWQVWRMPATNESILLLGDLGVNDSQLAGGWRWRRFLQCLEGHPAPVLTLSPAPQAPGNLQLCRQVRPNPLNDAYILPRHAKQQGFCLPLPDAQYLQELLAWLSPLPLIDSGLLRRFRDALHWGGSELETLLWNHADMQKTSLGIRLQAHCVETYRNIYQQKFAGTPQAEIFWQIVREHHAQAYAGLRQIEALNQSVLEGGDDEQVRSYFQRLCAAAYHEPDQHKSRALLMQCRTMLTCRPESIWNSSLADVAYGLYAIANAEAIRAGRWPEKLEAGFKPEKVAWLLDESARNQRVYWQIAATGGQGEFVCQLADTPNSVARPIALLAAQTAFPPVLQTASEAEAIRHYANAGKPISLQAEGILIQSTLEYVELDAINKPSWACAIKCTADGLVASLNWLGEKKPVFWQVGDEKRRGFWNWEAPFGEDNYGLYADLTVNKVTQRFRWLEPGQFEMGSPSFELEREAWDEGSETLHTVTLTKGFWLADTTVSQALWLAVMQGENPSRFKHNLQNLQNPVEQVSWDDTQAFIVKLNSLVPGLEAQLPTEAQWEYACRAGTTKPFSFGENISPEQVNYDGNYPYADAAQGVYREKTVPVKSLPANNWGMYEMHGNVWEWCQDAWQTNLGSEPVTDPLTSGADTGASRALRGGSWNDYGGFVRSAIHLRFAPVYRDQSFGFRLSLGHAELRSSKGAEGGGNS